MQIHGPCALPVEVGTNVPCVRTQAYVLSLLLVYPIFGLPWHIMLRYLGIDTSLPEAIDVLREYDSWPDGKLDLREFSRLVRHAANTS